MNRIVAAATGAALIGGIFFAGHTLLGDKPAEKPESAGRPTVVTPRTSNASSTPSASTNPSASAPPTVTPPKGQRADDDAADVAGRVLIAMNSFTPADAGLGAWALRIAPDLTASAAAFYAQTYPEPFTSSWWEQTRKDGGIQTATVASVVLDQSQRRTNTSGHESLLVALSVEHANVTYPSTMTDPAALGPYYAVNLDRDKSGWKVSYIHDAEQGLPKDYGRLSLRPLDGSHG